MNDAESETEMKTKPIQGDPYAAWAGAEKRLQNAMDTIFELRNRIAALERLIAGKNDTQPITVKQIRDALKAGQK